MEPCSQDKNGGSDQIGQYVADSGNQAEQSSVVSAFFLDGRNLWSLMRDAGLGQPRCDRVSERVDLKCTYHGH